MWSLWTYVPQKEVSENASFKTISFYGEKGPQRVKNVPQVFPEIVPESAEINDASFDGNIFDISLTNLSMSESFNEHEIKENDVSQKHY